MTETCPYPGVLCANIEIFRFWYENGGHPGELSSEQLQVRSYLRNNFLKYAARRNVRIYMLIP